MSRYLFIGFVILTLSCDNPFSEDEIAGDQRTLRGSVTLQGNGSPKGVYVWLEGIEVGTFTDEQGEFTLTIPPKSALNAGGEINGEFSLYFYSINYTLETKTVLLKNGSILYGKGNVGKDGIVPSTFLMKTFDAETRTAFNVVIPADTLHLSITAHFKAVGDSFKISLPKATMILLGGVFIRDLNSGTIYVAESETGTGEPYVELLKKRDRLWTFHPNIEKLGLPSGRYDILPYVFPYYPRLPANLLKSMGIESGHMSTAYLELCFTCQCAEFRLIL